MRQRDRVTIAAAAAAIAAAVLLIGGAPRWSLAIVSLPIVAAVGMQLTSRRGLEKLSPLLVLVGIAFGLTAVQAVPLPSAVQATLDPTGHALIEDSHELLGDSPPVVMPLSLDPPGTRRAALDLALALGLAWVLLRVATQQQGRYTILAAVAGVCGLAAAIGAIDKLLGVTALYGLYEPHHATPVILGPLLNPNSYGSLLVLGAMVSAGLALHIQQSSARRAAWAVNTMLCLVVAFATLSRGAALAAGIGAVTVAVMWLSGRRNEARDRRKPQLLRVTIPAVLIVACGVTLLVLTSAANVTRQIGDTSLSGEYNDPLSKYAAWRSSEQLVRESPWIGVGRGAFEPAFTRVHPESAFGTFSHLENEYVQAVVDWGLPGAAAMAFASAWLVLFALRRRREGPLAAGAIGALAAVAAQSTVDFGVELPGLLFPVIAVAATVTFVPLHEMNPAGVKRAVAARAALLAVIALLVALVVPPWGATLADDHDALLADDPPTLELARDAMRRHPLDYYAPARVALALFATADAQATRRLKDALAEHPPQLDYFAPARIALALLATGDSQAIRNVNHALVLHPTLPDLHRLAARLLAATGHPAQAKLEYQIAMRYTQNPVKLVGELVATFPRTEDAASALWLDFPNPEALTRILVEWKRRDVALRYLQALVEYQHGRHVAIDVGVIDLLEHTALDQGDLDAAEAAARLRLARDSGLASRLVLGRVLRKRGKLADAEQVLSAVPPQGPPADVLAAKQLLCDVQIDEKKWPEAEQCLRKMMESPNLTVPMLREIHGRLAGIADARGDAHRARLERAIIQGLAQ